MPPTLEAWDLVVPSLTARSRLYSLAPIGIGTAFVESLSGYVERLAAAHAVSAGSLLLLAESYLEDLAVPSPSMWGSSPMQSTASVAARNDGSKRWRP